MPEVNFNWEEFETELSDHATDCLKEALEAAKDLPKEEREAFVEAKLRECEMTPEPGAVAAILKDVGLDQ